MIKYLACMLAAGTGWQLVPSELLRAAVAEQAPRPEGKGGGEDTQCHHRGKFAGIGGQAVPLVNSSQEMHDGDEAEDCAGGDEICFHGFNLELTSLERM